jgi:uncharacterized short protein YbdD (DUF466 family)
MTSHEFVRSARARLERAACVVRRVIGVPDYDRYVSHMHTHHPEARPMGRDEFIRERQADRYSRPGTRCC